MELNERIAIVRKAAGLSQEQLGELLGVTRQAVSKWESGQTTPDAVTVAKLCSALRVSADFVLLGKEPDEETSQRADLPDTCPLCSGIIIGNYCANCGYPPAMSRDDDGTRYALIAAQTAFCDQSFVKQMHPYCADAEAVCQRAAELREYGLFFPVRRELKKQEVLWLASHLPHTYLMCIVEDAGEEDLELSAKNAAMPLPSREDAPKTPLSFGGVVAAVVVGIIVALVLLSFL